MIGSFGEIVFETSDAKILTPTALSRNLASNWASHELIQGKARTQYLGPVLQTLSFDVQLSSLHGIQPRAMLEKLEQLVEGSEAFPLIIGGKPLGQNSWRLTSVSETWGTMYSEGELASASVNLSLEEYV